MLLLIIDIILLYAINKQLFFTKKIIVKNNIEHLNGWKVDLMNEINRLIDEGMNNRMNGRLYMWILGWINGWIFNRLDKEFLWTFVLYMYNLQSASIMYYW